MVTLAVARARAQAPEPPSAAPAVNAFEPPPASTLDRPSGLTVLWASDPDAPRVEVRLVLGGGRAAEGGLPGLSALAARLLEEAVRDALTARDATGAPGALDAARDASAARDAPGVEADVRVAAGEWATVVSFAAPADELTAALGAVRSAVAEPSMTTGQLERARRAALWELHAARSDGVRLARARAEASHYEPAHPFGRLPLLEAAPLDGITRDHVALFTTSSAQPRGMLLVLVGAIDAPAAERAADALDRDWPGGERFDLTTMPVPRRDGLVVHLVPQRDAGRAAVALLVGGPGGHGPSAWTAELLAAVLGDPDGRLRRGLDALDRTAEGADRASNAGASLSVAFERRRSHGAYRIELSAPAAAARDAVQVVLDELGRVAGGGLARDELERARAHVRAALAAAYATPAATADTWAALWQDGALPVVHVAAGRMLPALSDEQVARAAASVMDLGQIVVALAGEPAVLRAALEHGPPLAVPAWPGGRGDGEGADGGHGRGGAGHADGSGATRPEDER